MNFLNIFENHVAGIFGAARAPFSFKKLARQAAHEMEDQTLVVNGVNTAPALYTILIAADDDPVEVFVSTSNSSSLKFQGFMLYVFAVMLLL